MSGGDVLRYLRDHGEGTSKDIAVESGLGITTIQENLRRLKKRGFIVSRKEIVPGRGGRCRVVYALSGVRT